MAFLGTFHPRLDDKGRLTLPAKFRSGLAGGLVVAKSQNSSLVVYPADAFEELVDQALVASRLSEGGLAYLRHLTRGADEQTPDGQGRITLTALHRQHAGLSKDCLVSGTGDHLEIWDAAAAAEYDAATQDQYARALIGRLVADRPDPAPPRP